MIFIPSASCDSTNSRSNRSINTSRCPGCNVYCRSSTIGQQFSSGGCASGFSIPKPCAANGTVAIRNFNARKIGLLITTSLKMQLQSEVSVALDSCSVFGGDNTSNDNTVRFSRGDRELRFTHARAASRFSIAQCETASVTALSRNSGSVTESANGIICEAGTFSEAQQLIADAIA